MSPAHLSDDLDAAEELDHVRSLIRTVTRRLHRLEQKAAEYGRECPVSVEIEIEDLRAELARLVERLDRLQGTLPPPVIVILEPDSKIADYLRRAVLRHTGDAYEVVLVHTPLEVATWISRRRVVLLITEYQLDVITIADDMIAMVQSVSPQTEMIVQTGSWSIGLEWRIRKLGVHYYIEKPFASDSIQILVDQALARTKGR